MDNKLFGLVFARSQQGVGRAFGPPDYYLDFAEDDARRDMAFSACNLASNSLDAFTGLYNSEWPFFGWGRVDFLPWSDRYWGHTQEEGLLVDATVLQQELFDMAEQIDREVAEREYGHSLLGPPGAIWLSRNLMSTKEGAVKGLAAQSLACANASLHELFQNRVAVSAKLLSRAYENIILLHIECQPIVQGRHRGGLARHRSDPKAQDKEFVKECWERWSRDPARYKTIEAFAKDMFEKTKHLEGNSQVIGRWVRDWRREAASSVRTKPPQA